MSVLRRSHGPGKGSAHEFSHASLLHRRLVPAVDLRDVVALNLCDILVHRQITRYRAVQYQDRNLRVKPRAYRTGRSSRTASCTARRPGPPGHTGVEAKLARPSKSWNWGAGQAGWPTMSLLSSPYFPVSASLSAGYRSPPSARG